MFFRKAPSVLCMYHTQAEEWHKVGLPSGEGGHLASSVCPPKFQDMVDRCVMHNGEFKRQGTSVLASSRLEQRADCYWLAALHSKNSSEQTFLSVSYNQKLLYHIPQHKHIEHRVTLGPNPKGHQQGQILKCTSCLCACAWIFGEE